MPRRKDLKKILVIGAGPIIIGQACEFDYSGTPFFVMMAVLIGLIGMFYMESKKNIITSDEEE